MWITIKKKILLYTSSKSSEVLNDKDQEVVNSITMGDLIEKIEIIGSFKYFEISLKSSLLK